jgi:hypothetical protein
MKGISATAGRPFHFLACRWQGVEDVKQAGNVVFAAAGVWAVDEIEGGAGVVVKVRWWRDGAADCLVLVHRHAAGRCGLQCAVDRGSVSPVELGGLAIFSASWFTSGRGVLFVGHGGSWFAVEDVDGDECRGGGKGHD